MCSYDEGKEVTLRAYDTATATDFREGLVPNDTYYGIEIELFAANWDEQTQRSRRNFNDLQRKVKHHYMS